MREREEREREKKIADLILLSLERYAYKMSPWLIPGNLDFRRVPFISRIEKMAHCVSNMVYAEYVHSFWGSGILV